MSNQLSNDAAVFEPIWGRPDSNVDWCESNYAITPYIAEFFNTISSVPISLFAILGIVYARRYASTEIRYTFAYFVVVLVGLGSVLFHGTLRRFAQACDELPMLYAALTFTYIILDNTHFLPLNNLARQNTYLTKQKVQHKLYTKIGLFSAAMLQTLIYYVFTDLYALFLIGFGAVTTFVFWATYFAIRKTNTVVLTKSPPTVDIEAGTLNNKLHQYVDFRHTIQLYNQAMYIYAIAGAFWLTENIFCPYLPTWCYFHAIWHITSGLATYMSVQAQIAWRAALFGRQYNILYVYKYIPYVKIEPISDKHIDLY